MRYRFPKHLGGGIREEHDTAEAPIGTVAFMFDGHLVCVARGLLTHIPPIQADSVTYLIKKYEKDIDLATLAKSTSGGYLAGYTEGLELAIKDLRHLLAKGQ